MKKLTIFTPSYNRAYLLPQLFNSLKLQTVKDFIWMVIDDGSTDNSKNLINDWKNDHVGFEITYIYQHNQGMHGAHNTAYTHINTVYNICIDSDDFMPKNAVEIILKELENLDEQFAGIVGLDADKNNNQIIGTRIPESLLRVKLNELYSIHHVKGDKKLVYRTDIVKKYPKYPLYLKERFVPLDYIYLLIDQDYDLKPINEVLCIVEYQSDGSSKNILQQYKKNPNGFAFSRISRINLGKTFKERFRNAIHLVSSAIFAKDYTWLLKSNETAMVFFAIPFGILLNFYIRFKT